MMAQKSFTQLLQLILTNDYVGAMALISSKDFDPNEADPLYKTSLLQSLIPQLSSIKSVRNNPELKEVMMWLISHESFNPNSKDVDGETILMTLSKYPSFNWLSRIILKIKNLDYNARDSYARTAYDIARTQHNTEFMQMFMDRFSPSKPHDEDKPQEESKGESSNELPSQVLQHLKFTFTCRQLENPSSMYWLIKAVLEENYSEALRLADSVHLDISEKDIWDEPAFMDMIEYIEMASDEVNFNVDELSKILDKIIKNRKFNPNMKNGDGNTPIMLAVQYKNLNWLTKMLYDLAGTELHHVNANGENILKIANGAGNDQFVLSLSGKSHTQN